MGWDDVHRIREQGYLFIFVCHEAPDMKQDCLYLIDNFDDKSSQAPDFFNQLLSGLLSIV